MKKSLKKLGLILTLTAGLALTTGCSDKKSDKVDVAAMTEKYAGYCTLGEYKGVEYQKTETVITEDDVQYQVDSLIATYSTSTEVTSGTVEDGDTVNIDFVGKIDGVEFEGGSTGGAGYELTLGSGTMIDGFEEQIVGYNVGDTFDIYVTFPEEYTEELAGKDAVFTITINSKFVVDSPEYNDAFVAANTDYDTVAAYEEYLMTTMTESAAASDEDKNKVAIVTNVIETSTVNEFPQQEMQKLIDDSMQEVQDSADASGYTLETYVTAVFGMASVEDLEGYIGEMVKSYMTEKIVLCSIAHAENITVSEDEIEAYKAEMMGVTGITDKETFDASYTAEDIAYYALAEKVVDFLLENGTPVEATTETAE